MYQDVVDLNAFYNTFLGQVARRQIRNRLREHWPNLAGLALLGIGFPTPYLRLFGDEPRRQVAVMPAAQGVIPWPSDGPSLVALADESELPFADESFDRVLLVHAIEASEALRPMLREVWRVMTGGGRLLVVAPNRRGIWARFENNPFAHGHPFSESQLNHLLRDSLFTPLKSTAALYVPPSNLRLTLRAAGTWERFGERWGLPFPGVILIESAKQIYAPTQATASLRRFRRRIALPLPAARSPKIARS
ncbi:MAG: methyltransferase domain-containing protein [Alphaproteobacteria bacterium]|nr:methyltransferase domain-containing protein [Alphaproteobacteria bacterium]